MTGMMKLSQNQKFGHETMRVLYGRFSNLLKRGRGQRRPYANNLSGGHFETVSDAGPTDEIAFPRNAGFHSSQ
jgi:hypothetical protein